MGTDKTVSPDFGIKKEGFQRGETSIAKPQYRFFPKFYRKHGRDGRYSRCTEHFWSKTNPGSETYLVSFTRLIISIGLREKLHETSTFHGKNNGFNGFG